MAGFEDLNQKVLIVVVFTAALLLVWWYIKTNLSRSLDLGGKGHLKHRESRRLANSSVLSVFEVDEKTVLVLQDKQGSSLLNLTDPTQRRSTHDT